MAIAYDPEESVTLAVAAHRLGCNKSTVRVMLRSGGLTGHLVGKGEAPRGIRVHASSIRDYKLRFAVAVDAKPPPQSKRSRLPSKLTSDQEEVLRSLRAMGMKI